MQAYSTSNNAVQRPASRQTAFTLIELLVVVAIIALLISILLPSLAHARRQAMRVLCQSNLRQQNMATLLYINDNDERYPIAKNFFWERYFYNDLTFANYTQDALIPYLGGVRGQDVPVDPVDYNIIAFSKVFRCPSVERRPATPNTTDPNGVSWIKSPAANHYRYNTHKAVVHPRPPRKPLGRAVGQVASPAIAILSYDIVFPQWSLKDIPHGTEGRRQINVAYADGHVAPMTGEEYFELSPHSNEPDYTDEGRNLFIANGWDKVYDDPNELSQE